LFADVLPQYLGVAWFGPSPVLPRALWWPVIGVLVAAFAVAVWRRGRRARQSADVILVAVLVTAVLYVASPYTWYAGEPRYLYPAVPLLAWGLAVLPPRALPVLVVAALSVATLLRYEGHYPAAWTHDLRAGARWLHDRGYSAAYADFRTAYPTEFVAGNVITVVPYGDNACRFPDLTARVDASPRFGYIAGTPATELDAALARQHIPVTQQRFGAVIVVLPTHPIRPWQVGLTARRGRC
jgi:hypothetical protein